MIRRTLARLGTVRVLALLGVIVIAATIGYIIYWLPSYPLLKLMCLSSSPYTHPCEAGPSWELIDHMVFIDEPYILTVEAENRVFSTELGPPFFNYPQCTVNVELSAPQFEVVASEVQSVDLVSGESASLTWALIPRQAGKQIVTVDYAPDDGSWYEHHGSCFWHVGVVDSAFEHMVGLTPDRMQIIGWFVGIGLLLPYFFRRKKQRSRDASGSAERDDGSV